MRTIFRPASIVNNSRLLCIVEGLGRWNAVDCHWKSLLNKSTLSKLVAPIIVGKFNFFILSSSQAREDKIPEDFYMVGIASLHLALASFVIIKDFDIRLGVEAQTGCSLDRGSHLVLFANLK